MSRFKLTFSLALVAAVVCIASAQAANITLSIVYNGSYDSLGNPKGPELNAAAAPAPGGPAVSLPTDIHEFNVFATITGLAAGEDLETLVYDANLGPGVTPLAPGEGGGFAASSIDGLHSASYLYDPPPDGLPHNNCGSGQCLSVFGTNADGGSNTNDLKAIGIVANGTGSTDFSAFAGVHYRHPGEAEAQFGTDVDNSSLPPPTYLGSLEVHWNGTSPSFIGLVDPANVTSPWTTRVASNNAQNAYGPATMDQSANLNWAAVAVPEPASLSLLGLAMVAGLGLIRRR